METAEEYPDSTHVVQRRKVDTTLNRNVCDNMQPHKRSRKNFVFLFEASVEKTLEVAQLKNATGQLPKKFQTFVRVQVHSVENNVFGSEKSSVQKFQRSSFLCKPPGTNTRTCPNVQTCGSPPQSLIERKFQLNQNLFLRVSTHARARRLKRKDGSYCWEKQTRGPITMQRQQHEERTRSPHRAVSWSLVPRAPPDPGGLRGTREWESQSGSQ